jgi:hypothetical protein
VIGRKQGHERSKKIPIHFFRTFPSGAAGLGLFLLRVITALTLGYAGYSVHERSAAAGAYASTFARLVSLLLPSVGVLMILGLATVISGILLCGLLLVSFGWLNPESKDLFAIASGLSLVLILLGPGAYSLDALFLGWRRVEIVRRTPKPKP